MARPTTRDIAKKAGVSQSTVSLVLNGSNGSSISAATREKVLEAAHQMGYKKKRPQQRKVQTIAFFVPTLTNLFYPQIAQTAQEYAMEKDILLTIYNTMRNRRMEERCLKQAIGKGIDGIIFAYTPMTDPARYKLPMTLVGEKDESLQIDTVGFSSVRSGEMITEHLVELGYKRFAFISGPLDNVSLSRRRRFEGVQIALERHGMLPQLTALIDSSESEESGAAYEFMVGKRMATAALLKCDQPLAIIAVNDMTACGVVSSLVEKGVKIPEEVAVCGFDNILLSEVMVPQLTTVDHMSNYRIRQAIDILVGKIRDNDPYSPNLVVDYEPRVIIRASTRKEIRS